MKELGAAIHEKYKKPMGILDGTLLKEKPFMIRKRTEPELFRLIIEPPLIHKKAALFTQSNKMLIKNNIVTNLNFKLAEREKTTARIVNSGMIWLGAANVNSEYELYLQMSMIRDVYEMYRRITKHTLDRKNILKYQTDEDDRRIERLGNIMFQRFASFAVSQFDAPKRSIETFKSNWESFNIKHGTEFANRRVIYDNVSYRPLLLTQKESPSPAVQEIDRTYTENQIHTHRRIESDSSGGRSEVQNTVNRLNIESVMDRVYKKLEDKLRHERLKKGF